MHRSDFSKPKIRFQRYSLSPSMGASPLSASASLRSSFSVPRNVKLSVNIDTDSIRHMDAGVVNPAVVYNDPSLEQAPISNHNATLSEVWPDLHDPLVSAEPQLRNQKKAPTTLGGVRSPEKIVHCEEEERFHDYIDTDVWVTSPVLLSCQAVADREVPSNDDLSSVPITPEDASSEGTARVAASSSCPELLVQQGQHSMRNSTRRSRAATKTIDFPPLLLNKLAAPKGDFSVSQVDDAGNENIDSSSPSSAQPHAPDASEVNDPHIFPADHGLTPVTLKVTSISIHQTSQSSDKLLHTDRTPPTKQPAFLDVVTPDQGTVLVEGHVKSGSHVIIAERKKPIETAIKLSNASNEKILDVAWSPTPDYQIRKDKAARAAHNTSTSFVSTEADSFGNAEPIFAGSSPADKESSAIESSAINEARRSTQDSDVGGSAETLILFDPNDIDELTGDTPSKADSQKQPNHVDAKRSEDKDRTSPSTPPVTPPPKVTRIRFQTPLIPREKPIEDWSDGDQQNLCPSPTFSDCPDLFESTGSMTDALGEPLTGRSNSIEVENENEFKQVHHSKSVGTSILSNKRATPRQKLKSLVRALLAEHNSPAVNEELIEGLHEGTSTTESPGDDDGVVTDTSARVEPLTQLQRRSSTPPAAPLGTLPNSTPRSAKRNAMLDDIMLDAAANPAMEEQTESTPSKASRYRKITPKDRVVPETREFEPSTDLYTFVKQRVSPTNKRILASEGTLGHSIPKKSESNARKIPKNTARPSKPLTKPLIAGSRARLPEMAPVQPASFIGDIEKLVPIPKFVIPDTANRNNKIHAAESLEKTQKQARTPKQVEPIIQTSSGEKGSKNLAIFGREPQELPRTGRVRRPPGEWWAATGRTLPGLGSDDETLHNKNMKGQSNEKDGPLRKSVARPTTRPGSKPAVESAPSVKRISQHLREADSRNVPQESEKRKGTFGVMSDSLPTKRRHIPISMARKPASIRRPKGSGKSSLPIPKVTRDIRIYDFNEG